MEIYSMGEKVKPTFFYENELALRMWYYLNIGSVGFVTYKISLKRVQQLLHLFWFLLHTVSTPDVTRTNTLETH